MIQLLNAQPFITGMTIIDIDRHLLHLDIIDHLHHHLDSTITSPRRRSTSLLRSRHRHINPLRDRRHLIDHRHIRADLNQTITEDNI